MLFIVVDNAIHQALALHDISAQVLALTALNLCHSYVFQIPPMGKAVLLYQQVAQNTRLDYQRRAHCKYIPKKLHYEIDLADCP
jgi:hypothetical protein